ncbi:uncharacterized protein LOC121386535 [Gigantopelta aegis]|uniref:uncharacterized protein LOC121386535 n=1 Tax=Gigantopelta aegis TaxID=1735272 RepID=UPI001B88C6D0|nr:uncharacterized protein LOC121386535 [Gigantopelta aegis]
MSRLFVLILVLIPLIVVAFPHRPKLHRYRDYRGSVWGRYVPRLGKCRSFRRLYSPGEVIKTPRRLSQFTLRCETRGIVVDKPNSYCIYNRQRIEHRGTIEEECVTFRCTIYMFHTRNQWKQLIKSTFWPVKRGCLDSKNVCHSAGERYDDGFMKCSCTDDEWKCVTPPPPTTTPPRCRTCCLCCSGSIAFVITHLSTLSETDCVDTEGSPRCHSSTESYNDGIKQCSCRGDRWTCEPAMIVDPPEVMCPCWDAINKRCHQSGEAGVYNGKHCSCVLRKWMCVELDTPTPPMPTTTTSPHADSMQMIYGCQESDCVDMSQSPPRCRGANEGYAHLDSGMCGTPPTTTPLMIVDPPEVMCQCWDDVKKRCYESRQAGVYDGKYCSCRSGKWFCSELDTTTPPVMTTTTPPYPHDTIQVIYGCQASDCVDTRTSRSRCHKRNDVYDDGTENCSCQGDLWKCRPATTTSPTTPPTTTPPTTQGACCRKSNGTCARDGEKMENDPLCFCMGSQWVCA